MNCSDFEQLVDPFLDGELSGTLRLEFDTHRLRCPLCQQKLAMMEACETVLTRDEQTPALSDDFTDRVMAAIAARQPAREPATSRVRLKLHLPHVRLPRQLLVPLQAAAAAAFLFAIYATWGGRSTPATPAVGDPAAPSVASHVSPTSPTAAHPASGEFSPLRKFADVRVAVMNDLAGVKRLVTDATVSEELTRMLTEDPFTRFLSLIVPSPVDESRSVDPAADAPDQPEHFSL